MSKKVAILLVVMAGVAGLAWFFRPRPSLAEFNGVAMTMEYRILVGHPLSSRHHHKVRQVIEATFQEIDETYNNWNPLSEVSRLNRAEAHALLPISQELETFLKRIDKWVVRTEGLFDPTIAPLQQLWRAHLIQGSLPSLGELQAISPAVGWEKVRVGGGLFYKQDPRISLDLGGVAKGYCIDLVVERLHAMGYHNLYASWSGEIRTTGSHPDKRPWRIAIQPPKGEGATTTIELHEGAVATSGNYRQYWPAQGGCYTHICNPRTLEALPVRPGCVASVTVVAPTCFLADLVATALMIPPSCHEAARLAAKLQEIEPSLQVWILPAD